MLFNTGLYAGTSAEQHIDTGFGGAPDFVVVKIIGSARYARWKHSGFGDAAAIRLGSGLSGSDCITSFNTDGTFTLDASGNVDVNASGNNYWWCAWKQDGLTDFEVGTYAGDGNATQNISIGFDPVAVWVLQGAYAAIRLLSDTDARALHGSGATTDQITALGTGQFTVGTNLNTSSTTYYYLAFKQVNDYIDEVYHTGDGSDNRTIALDNTTTAIPQFVWTANTSAGRAPAIRSQTSNTPFATNEAGQWTASAFSGDSNTINSFVTDGFTVGTNRDVNFNAEGYASLWMVSTGSVGGGGGTSLKQTNRNYYSKLIRGLK